MDYIKVQTGYLHGHNKINFNFILMFKLFIMLNKNNVLPRRTFKKLTIIYISAIYIDLFYFMFYYFWLTYLLYYIYCYVYITTSRHFFFNDINLRFVIYYNFFFCDQKTSLFWDNWSWKMPIIKIIFSFINHKCIKIYCSVYLNNYINIMYLHRYGI